MDKRKYIPYYMCLNCDFIYRADVLDANEEHWEFEYISTQQCPNCGKREDIWVEICPFETFQKEINESRCIIPLITPHEVKGRHISSWFCIFHTKMENCPLFSIFTGKKKR